MDVGDRVILRADTKDDEGAPATRGEAGMVIGHQGREVVVSMDIGENYAGNSRVIIVEERLLQKHNRRQR